MGTQGSTAKTDLPKEDATLAPIINMQEFRDQTKIPHKVLESIDKGSPLEAMTHLEFRENIKYLRDKILEVNNRPDKAFKEAEVHSLLKKFSRTIPILNDRKDYLIENGLLRDGVEFEEVRNLIIETLERPSVCNTNTFSMYRSNLAELTENKTLSHGFENIEKIRQQLPNAQPQKIEDTVEIRPTKPIQTNSKSEESSSGTNLTADFKIPEEILTGKGVHFENNSLNGKTFAWRIERNGVVIATILGRRELENYVFPEEGDYSVTLFSSNGKETFSTTKFINVQTNPDPAAEINTPETKISQLNEPQTDPKQKTEVKLNNTTTAEPDWYSLLDPKYIATLTPFERQDLIQQAVKAGKYDPIFFQDPKIIEQATGIQKLDIIQELVKKREALKETIQPIIVPEVTNESIPATQPPINIEEENSSLNKIFTNPKNNEVEILNDLVKLSPLGRRAIWGMLSKTQRQHLIDNPYKEEWQEIFDEVFKTIYIEPAKAVRNYADEKSGFKNFRIEIKTAFNKFKKDRMEQLSNSAKNGNIYSKWLERKYLAYKRDKNNKKGILKLAGYLGKEAIKTLVSPITNAYNDLIKTKFVNNIIRVVQGTGNFAGKSIATIGRIAGGVGKSLGFAFLPTLVSSYMGLNPILAAGLFSSLGLAGQIFNKIDLFKNPSGFKLPFIDGTLRKLRVLNELRLNPQKYAGESIAKISKPYREIVNEFRTSPDIAKAGKWFTASKHLFKAVPLGSIATGLGFLLTGNLPLSLLLGGITMGVGAGAGYAVERLSMLLGKGLTSFPLFRHIFKFPGMSFLDAAEGSQWINQEMKFIQNKGFDEWLKSQNDSVMQLGSVNVTKGMSNAIMLGRTILGGIGITRFFTSIPSAISSISPGLAGTLLSKIPLLTRIAAPVAILGYLGAVATGITAFSWATFLGITFGAVAGSLTFALLTSTGIGALVGLPVATVVSYFADKVGNWVGAFFDKTAEIVNDMNIVGLIPLVQLGKALYDIVNTSIDDFSDYARIGLISLSIIPALGILTQLAQNQASANFESSKPSVTTTTLNYEKDTADFQLKVDNYEYDCNTTNQQIFYSELQFIPQDIISITKNDKPIYNIKGKALSGESIIYRNMTNINPQIQNNMEVKSGEIVGSC